MEIEVTSCTKAQVKKHGPRVVATHLLNVGGVKPSPRKIAALARKLEVRCDPRATTFQFT